MRAASPSQEDLKEVPLLPAGQPSLPESPPSNARVAPAGPANRPRLVPALAGAAATKKTALEERDERVYKQAVAKMQEMSGERGAYITGRGPLDHDDLLFLKEQSNAMEDEERLRRRLEKRAFAAFRAAAGQADASGLPAAVVPRVELKPKRGIRLPTVIKSGITVKPKQQGQPQKSGVVVASSAAPPAATSSTPSALGSSVSAAQTPAAVTSSAGAAQVTVPDAPGAKGLLGLAYESSSDEEEAP